MGQTVSIALGERSYAIRLGTGLIEQLGSLVAPFAKTKRVFLIGDACLESLSWIEKARNSLEQEGLKVISLSIPSGEQSKSYAQYAKTIEELISFQVSREDLILAFGGGVVGDLAGFVAASVLRGVPFVQIPTTLLAQVDSSVGGKTGINSPQGKNLIGAFYQPKEVLIDFSVLKTLSRRELKSGLAEVIKYGLINQPDFFAWIKENGEKVLNQDLEALEKAVRVSVQAKAAIVCEDEKEAGVRALLNLGHTFGHALETVFSYDGRLLHGEAVALGTVLAFDFSVYLGLCAPQEADSVRQCFKTLGYAYDLQSFLSEQKVSVQPQTLIDLMAKDKKMMAGELTFILVKGIGKAFIQKDVSVEKLLAFLSQKLA